MKQKLICTLFIVFVFSISAIAQFQHSIGASLITGKGKIPAGAEEGSVEPRIDGFGVFYYPRLNVSESETGALSVGIPLTAGFSGSVNSREGGSMSVILDFPITLDYNFGLGSMEGMESNFGGFVGAGFGYTYSNYSQQFYIPGVVEDYQTVKGSSYGPLAHGGVKVLIGEKTYFLRAFYKIGLDNAKFKTFGVAAGISL